MRFALDSSHQDFAASIDALLTKSDMPAVIRSWNDGDTEPGKKLWQRLSETGVNGLVISEEHDGLGADAVDLVVALEQLGRHAVPGPVVETIAVAPTLLASVAPERLSALAEGSLATVAAPPRTPFALDADAVDLVLLAQDGAVSLGVPGEAKASVDLSRKLYAVSAGESLGSADFSAAFDMGALATAAQLQGLGQTLLEVTTEYAKQRKQFGKVIGQFQAMKHHLAEVAVSLEMARPLLHGAALSVRDQSADASRDISAAKVACGGCCVQGRSRRTPGSRRHRLHDGTRSLLVAHQGTGAAHPRGAHRPSIAHASSKRWLHHEHRHRRPGSIARIGTRSPEQAFRLRCRPRRHHHRDRLRRRFVEQAVRADRRRRVGDSGGVRRRRSRFGRGTRGPGGIGPHADPVTDAGFGDSCRTGTAAFR